MTDVLVSQESGVRSQRSAVSIDELLRLAASAERGSEHPLGEAIVRSAEEKHLVLSTPDAFEGIAGFGISATVDGHAVLLGNLRLMQREQVNLNGSGA